MIERHKKKHAFILVGLATGMFGFSFALVPLYNVFCEITGLNGRTSNQAALLEEIGASAVPTDREVTIEFLASVNRGLAWEFRPLDAQLVVRPGEVHTTTFYVRNRAQETLTGQAVPSVSPGQAARFLKKIECFCFEQQELPAGGEIEMGVRFFVDADLPASIHKLTLSYRMFRVSNPEHEQVANQYE